MNENYCTRREEELEEQVLSLRIAFLFLGLLAMFGMMLLSNNIEDLKEQNQIVYDSTENCQCPCPQKEVFYVDIDQLTSPVPQIVYYVRDEGGNFIKTNDEKAQTVYPIRTTIKQPVKKKNRMNKEKQLKSLTWKYFFQQKIEEISKFVLIPIGTIIILYLSSYFGRWLDVLYCDIEMGCELTIKANETFWQHMGYGLMGILSLGIIAFILWGIGYFIYGWIQSNWKKAKERAKRDLNIK